MDEELRKMVEEDKKARMEACYQAVESALKQYNCTMEPKLIVTQQGNSFIVDIIPKD